MSDLSDLIERVRAASGPSRDLDGRVWCAVNDFEFVMWDGAGCVYTDPRAAAWDQGIKHAPASTVKPFSASTDQGLLLVHRALPTRWEIAVGTCGEQDVPWACITEPDDPCRDFSVSAPTIPLAIIEALLLSLQELTP